MRRYPLLLARLGISPPLSFEAIGGRESKRGFASLTRPIPPLSFEGEGDKGGEVDSV
jgi:hypothetical protein